MPTPVIREAVRQPEDGSYALIALTQNKVAKVSAEDYEMLSAYNWFAHWSPTTQTFYAKRHSKAGEKRLIGMHSHLTPCSKGFVPDHINGDTLDNRRENLQSIPHSLNLVKQTRRKRGSTGFMGVKWDKARGKYMATLQQRQLGRYASFEEACAVRQKAVDELFFAHSVKQG